MLRLISGSSAALKIILQQVKSFASCKGLLDAKTNYFSYYRCPGADADARGRAEGAGGVKAER